MRTEIRRLARADIAAGSVFVVVRLAVLLAGTTARRSGDSVTYLPGVLPTLDFLGDAVKLWAVPLLFRIAPTDGTRMLAQHLIATGAWLLLAFAIRSRLRTPSVRTGALVAVMVLALSQQVIGWDAVMLSESLGMSLTMIVTALWLLRTRLSLVGNALLGLAAVVLMFARISVMALPVLVAVTAGVAAVRAFRDGQRVALRPHLVVLAILVVGFVWLGIALPRQNDAYRLRDDLGISYGGELAATLLWDRLLADPASLRWLEERGMPEPRGGIVAAPNGVGPIERAITWPPFLETAAGDGEWRRWLDDQGSSLPVAWMIERPTSAARTLRDLLPITLASGWEDGIIGYGPATVTGVSAWPQPFFRGRGVVSDLVVLGVAVAALFVVCRRRAARVDGSLLVDGVIVAVVALSAVAIGVLFSGLEYTRHALPGPHLLRVAAVMMIATLADALLRRDDREAVEA